MSKRLNAETIEIHQKTRQIGDRLRAVLRHLAVKHSSNIVVTDSLYGMACSLGFDYDWAVFGFKTSNVTRLNSRCHSLSLLCLLQVVHTALMYFRLFSATGDPQDFRSCIRYVEWLEAYAANPSAFSIAGDVRHGWYLWKPVAGQESQPPEWLREGETI